MPNLTKRHCVPETRDIQPIRILRTQGRLQFYWRNYILKAKSNRNTQDVGDHEMDESLYEVTFSGEIQEGAKLDEVKARIGKMFKADEVTIARLFSGKRIVIKKNLSAEAADKYSIAFAKAGAICDLTLVPADTAPTDDQAARTAPSAPPPAAPKPAPRCRKARRASRNALREPH